MSLLLWGAFLWLRWVRDTLFCSVQTSHCHDFSCFRAQDLGHQGFHSCGVQLRCFVESGIFPDQGSRPHVMHWQADSQPMNHLGNPWGWNLNYWTSREVPQVMDLDARTCDRGFVPETRHELVLWDERGICHRVQLTRIVQKSLSRKSGNLASTLDLPPASCVALDTSLWIFLSLFVKHSSLTSTSWPSSFQGVVLLKL